MDKNQNEKTQIISRDKTPEKENKTETKVIITEKPNDKPKEQADFEDKMKTQKSPLDSWAFYWRFAFGWVSPIISIATKYGLTLDMMPNLPQELKHRAYSNKIRYYYDHLIEESRKKKQSISKLFILRLLILAFKYDIILTLFFVTVLTLTEYSSSFFIYLILTIPDSYDPEQHIKMFAIFSSMLIAFKIFNTILNDNVYFWMVN